MSYTITIIETENSYLCVCFFFYLFTCIQVLFLKSKMLGILITDLKGLQFTLKKKRYIFKIMFFFHVSHFYLDNEMVYLIL